MAVFLSASDETLGEGLFHHAGYVAPIESWVDVIVPAWQEKVLNGPPKIDEFHMTDIRSRSWREKRGVTEKDADDRIDAAVDLVHKAGLFSIRSSIDDVHFAATASGYKFRPTDQRRAPTEFVIDYPSFHGYVYVVLYQCSALPNVEKVDFVVERKKEVFGAMLDFWQLLPESFSRHGLPHFAEMMGELIPGDKKRIPLQAADLLCWHTQRCMANAKNPSITFSDTDRERLSKLTRFGIGTTWPRELVEELFKGLFEDWRKLNEDERISEIRSSDGDNPSRRSQSSERSDGSGETS
jgi:hypothetical protein